jgi:hypothetical protein
MVWADCGSSGFFAQVRAQNDTFKLIQIMKSGQPELTAF